MNNESENQKDAAKLTNGIIETGKLNQRMTSEESTRIGKLFAAAQFRAHSEISTLFREMVIAIEGHEPLQESVPKHAARKIDDNLPHIEHWLWRDRILFTVYDPFHKDEKLVVDREFKQSFSPTPEHHVQLIWSVVIPRDDMIVLAR